MPYLSGGKHRLFPKDISPTHLTHTSTKVYRNDVLCINYTIQHSKTTLLLQPLRLKEEDFLRSAASLQVEVATVKAVQEVETGGRGGFFGVGKPAILFEGHIFWNHLKKKGKNPEDYLSGNEDILYPKWTKAHYKGGKGGPE